MFVAVELVFAGSGDVVVSPVGGGVVSGVESAGGAPGVAVGVGDWGGGGGDADGVGGCGGGQGDVGWRGEGEEGESGSQGAGGGVVWAHGVWRFRVGRRSRFPVGCGGDFSEVFLQARVAPFGGQGHT